MWNDLIGDINPPTQELGSTEGVAAIISRGLDAVYAIAGVATMGLLLLGGIKIIMCEGDPEKLKEGKDTLTNAILGIVVILVSGLVFQYIGRLLGVESLITWFNFKLS